MDKKHQYFEQLCDPAFLMQAWKQVRINRGAAGVDQVSVYEYEGNLAANIRDLAARLREGRYLPMPYVHFETPKANGRMRMLGIGTVEDRIVYRALYDLLERIWEPVFMECSYGFRRNRNVEMAVKRVLDYRAEGDSYVLDADIADCFGALDHEVVLGLIGQRVRDKRLLGLIRLALAAGQSGQTEAAAADGAPVSERVVDFAAGAVNDVMTRMLGETGYGYHGYGTYSSPMIEDDETPPGSSDPAAELRRTARKEAFKRLGRDAFLLGLTCFGRSRRMFSPATLAMTGAAVLATAAYPKASRMIRERMGRRPGGAGAVQGSALSPLLANIVLHEFDLAMLHAGFHLVRYADDWVVTSRDAEGAQRALDFAARKLAELHLRLNPDKTRIIRFDQGLEFLGYKFDRFLLTAAPPPDSTQQPVRAVQAVKQLVSEATAALHDKAAPAISRAGKLAFNKGRAGVNRVAGFLKRRVNAGEERPA